MIKKIIVIFFLIAVIYLIYLITYHPKTKTVSIKLGNIKYDFEIAKTISQKSIGLSGRTSLCKNCGMIFIYSSEGIYPFWMKDTLIPLDMIWLDKTGKIITYHNAQPEPNIPLTKLKNYANSTPAKYILEINSGDFTKLNLKIGGIINLPNFNEKI